MHFFSWLPAEIQALVFDQLDPADLFRLKAVSRELHGVVTAYKAREPDKFNDTALAIGVDLYFHWHLLNDVSKVWRAIPSGALRKIEGQRKCKHPDQADCRALVRDVSSRWAGLSPPTADMNAEMVTVDLRRDLPDDDRFKIDIRVRAVKPATYMPRLCVFYNLQSFSRTAHGGRLLQFNFDGTHAFEAREHPMHFDLTMYDSPRKPRWTAYASPVTIRTAPLHREAVVGPYLRIFKLMCRAFPELKSMPGMFYVVVVGAHTIRFKITARDVA